ncbi:hypothetical protein KI387_016302, partial [Taxus chinensis]
KGHEARDSSDEYSPKPQKLWSITKPMDYLLKEQRLVFIFIGIALASMFFILQHGFFASNGAEETIFQSSQPHQQVAYENPVARVANFDLHANSMVNSGAKVPLGLKRKSLHLVRTGGTRFVGSHLVDRLMERGDSVIVVDNLFTGRKENVMHHFGNPRFEMIRHDVVEPFLLEVDLIYHLACPASPFNYKFNPIKTIKTNVVGTLNMLGLA